MELNAAHTCEIMLRIQCNLRLGLMKVTRVSTAKNQNHRTNLQNQYLKHLSISCSLSFSYLSHSFSFPDFVLLTLFALLTLLTLFKLLLLVDLFSFALNFFHLFVKLSLSPSSLYPGTSLVESELALGNVDSLPRSTLSTFLSCPCSFGSIGSSLLFLLPRSINSRVCHAAIPAIGLSAEFPWTSAFFQGQCSRWLSSKLRRSDSMGTSSFLLISCKRASEESHSPSRWKQWLHTASEIRDSETPVQPKSAKAKAIRSVGVEGGVPLVVEAK